MNALARFSTSSIARASAGARMMSTAAKDPARAHVNKIKAHGKSVWVSDAGAYPVMAVCAIALVGCSSFIGYKFTFCDDVRVDRNKRGSVIRYWGTADDSHVKLN